MAIDKKISQLPLSGGINTTDISVLVDLDTTLQYSFSQLLAYLGANLASGAVFTFSTGAIPANTVGKNGDVYVKTNTGQFAQKLSGIWTVVYTIVQGVIGSTIFYGATTPSAGTGINGDTYLKTVGGIFYQKVSGAWVAKFSMATGPVGPPGTAGTNGTNGTNGLTVLSGVANPSNGLGVNGDFYINYLTWYIFGPKASGAWPAGVSIIGPLGPAVTPVSVSFSSVSTKTINWQTDVPPGYPGTTYAALLGNVYPRPYVFNNTDDKIDFAMKVNRATPGDPTTDITTVVFDFGIATTGTIQF